MIYQKLNERQMNAEWMNKQKSGGKLCTSKIYKLMKNLEGVQCYDI